MIFIARAYTVEGPSMLPTLVNGERLMVDKITYRFRPPRRGEIVVFRYPANPKESFIKRVIGVPSDTIQIYGGVVYINGQPLSMRTIWERLFTVGLVRGRSRRMLTLSWGITGTIVKIVAIRELILYPAR